MHYEDIEVNGITYRVNLLEDDHGAPWEECDGHGEVSDWSHRDKRPGELILNSDHGSKRFYDFEASMKKAKKDGWGMANPPEGATPGKILELAVMRDYNHLKAWCDNEWHYVTVQVYPLTEDGDELVSKSEYLGGVEDSEDAYIKEVALQLIGEIA